MEVSEEVAKTKWCPMYIRGGTGDSDATRRDAKCIASDCMMWRLAYSDENEQHTTQYGWCGLVK